MCSMHRRTGRRPHSRPQRGGSHRCKNDLARLQQQRLQPTVQTQTAVLMCLLSSVSLKSTSDQTSRPVSSLAFDVIPRVVQKRLLLLTAVHE